MADAKDMANLKYLNTDVYSRKRQGRSIKVNEANPRTASTRSSSSGGGHSRSY